MMINNKQGDEEMTRILPVPEIVFCDTPYGTAYVWKCDKYGLCVYGNTRLDAQVEFMEAYELEYNKPFISNGKAQQVSP